MPLVVKDRVRETSTTAGTGTFTLAGAVTGYQSFSAVGDGNTTYYTIYLQGGNEWEVGIGTYTASGTTLSRDTILASSNGGSAVNFSAGVKDVFVTYPAGRSVYYDTATNVTLNALTVTGALAANGGTTIGDASGDAFTINSSAVSTPNGLNFDSNTFVIDAANDRVGIGTATPAGKLSVVDSAAAGGSATNQLVAQQTLVSSAAALALRSLFTNTFNTNKEIATLELGIVTDGTASTGADISLKTINTGTLAERLRITSGGQVNIGGNFTSTNNTLQVTGNAAIGYTTAAPTTGLIVAGNVGIGTDTPAARVDVLTTGQALKLATAANQTHIELRDTTNSKSGYINYNNDSLIYYRNGPVMSFTVDTSNTFALRQSSNAANTSVSFNTTVQDALTLNSSGDLGIGVTSYPNEGSLAVRRGAIDSFSGTGYRTASFYSTTAANADQPGIVLGYDTAGAGIVAARTNATGQPLAFWTFNGSSWGERARISSGGDVGIGTTSPATKLDIVGTLTSRAATSGAGQNVLVLRAVDSGNANFANAQYYANSHFWGYAGSSNGMTLDSSGNLGLGLTPSAWASGQIAIEVGGSVGNLAFNSTAATREGYIYWNSFYNGTNTLYKANGYAIAYGHNSGQHQWFNAPSGTAGNAISFTQAMTLDASGNLLVGLTSSNLAAGRGLMINAPAGQETRLKMTNANSGSTTYDGFDLVVGTSGDVNLIGWEAQPMTFYTAGTIKARIDSGGTFRVTGAGAAGSTDAVQFSGSAPASSLLLNSSGNLGLGVTPSAWGAASKAIQFGAFGSLSGSTGNFAGIATNRYNDGANKYIGTGLAALYEQGNGVHAWYIAPSGTAGNAISFTQAMTLHASGGLSVGNTTDPSGGSVNIGVGAVNSNNYLLRISAGTSGLSRIIAADTSDRGYIDYNHTADAWQFYTSGTEKMYLDSSGNLGLGVTPSAWAATSKAITVGFDGGLQLAGGTSNTQALFTTNLVYTGTGATGWKLPNNVAGSYYEQYLGAHKWYYANANGVNGDATPIQAMTLDASGNLALGTTSATGQASNNRVIQIYGAGTANRAQIHFCNSDTGETATDGSFLGIDTNRELFIINREAAATVFQNSGSESARITSAGNLLVGNTAQFGADNRVAVFSANKFGLSIIDTTAQTTGVGGALNLGGNYRTTGDAQAFVRVAAAKENSTDNNYAYAMTFATTPNGGTFTEAARITSGGDFGLGVTSTNQSGAGSARVLTIGGTSQAFTEYVGTTGSGLATGSLHRNASALVGGIVVENATGNQGIIEFNTNNGTTYGERARIDASGNLVVGATSTSYRMEVVGPSGDNIISVFRSGDATAANNAGGGFRSISSATAASRVAQLWLDADGANLSGGDYFYIQKNGNSGAVDIVQYSNAAMTFHTNATERARITSGGYFKASNDGTYLDSAGPYHEIRQTTTGNNTLQVSNNTADPYGVVIAYTGASPNGTGNYFLYCRDSGPTLRAEIRSNGGLANYQSNNVDLSDIRTKTDINPLASYWNKIAALEIVSYKYKDQTHDDLNIGVIAQQVEQVAPEFVDADGFGETPEDGVPLKTIYNKDLTFAAIKALQEAMARIETLEAEVAALKGV